MSSDIQPGDVVVCVSLCLHGLHVHEDGDLDGLDLTGSVHRVSSWLPPQEDWPGGWFLFEDGDGWCDGCVRKLNDEPDNAELIERIMRCLPAKQGVRG